MDDAHGEAAIAVASDTAALTGKNTQLDTFRNGVMEDKVENGEAANEKVLDEQCAQKKFSNGEEKEEEQNEEGMTKQVPIGDGLNNLSRDHLVTDGAITKNEKEKSISESDSKGESNKADMEQEGADEDYFDEEYFSEDSGEMRDEEEEMNEQNAEEEDIYEEDADEPDMSEEDDEIEDISEEDAEEAMSGEDAEEEVNEDDYEDEMSEENSEDDAMSQEDAEDDGMGDDPEENAASVEDTKGRVNEVVECKELMSEKQKSEEATRYVDSDVRVVKNEEKDTIKSKGKGTGGDKSKRKILTSRSTGAVPLKATEDRNLKKEDKNDAASNDILKKMVSSGGKGASESVGIPTKSSKKREKMTSRGKITVVSKHAEEKGKKDEECKDQEVVNESKLKGTVKDEEKSVVEAKKESNRLNRRNKRKRAMATKEAVATHADKSISRETKKKFMGMIFMCSSKTKVDCYNYSVLGLPAGKRDMVLKISKGTKLFLYDFDLKLMYGIYEAAGPGGYNLEPKAFKSAFPSQVRFRVSEDCLPLAEEKFKKILKENYYTKTKFNCQLSAEQVKNLCKLFRAAGRAPGSKQSRSNRMKQSRSNRAEMHSSLVQEKPRNNLPRKEKPQRKRRKREEGPSSSRYKEYRTGPVIREREVYAPPVSHLPLHHLSPPPAPTYAPVVYAYDPYERTRDRDYDPYGRTRDRDYDPYERTQARGFDPYERSRDSDVYRHHIVSGQDEHRYLDSSTRREGEMIYHDPYVSHQRYQVSREPLYSAGSPTLYRRADPLPDYYSGGVLPERSFHSRLYRY